MPAVKPEILRWARETSELGLDQAAKAIGLGTARGKTGAERLAALEVGEDQPTRTQLTRMAKAYRRSLLIFYLEAPPPPAHRGTDFRRTPGSGEASLGAQLDALIRDIHVRQSLIRDLLDDEESPAIEFVGSLSMNLNAEMVAERVIRAIHFDRSVYRSKPNYDAAFDYLRQCIQEIGIFVLLLGNLGSHHSAISVEDFRGFAISDPLAPMIVINENDSKAAWSFTALHELVHIGLGTTGVSGPFTSAPIEHFCNDVAGAVLLSGEELRLIDTSIQASSDDVARLIEDFAKQRNVSSSMVAYQLYRRNRISQDRWSELRDFFFRRWRESQEQRKLSRSEEEGGPNYYKVRKQRLGRAIVGLVERGLDGGALSPSQAGKILGVKPMNVHRLLDMT